MSLAEAPHFEDWRTPEIKIKEGTRAYGMPLFSDRNESSHRFLGIEKGLPRPTSPEAIQDRMNAFFKQITDQGGEIIGFHSEPIYNGLREQVCQYRFIVVKK